MYPPTSNQQYNNNNNNNQSNYSYSDNSSSNTTLPRYGQQSIIPTTPLRSIHPLSKVNNHSQQSIKQPQSSNYQQQQQPAYKRIINKPYTGLNLLYRKLSGQSIADSHKDDRHVKLPRLGYLDGFKFIAALIVLNSSLFDAVLSNNDLTVIQINSPLYIFRLVFHHSFLLFYHRY